MTIRKPTNSKTPNYYCKTKKLSKFHMNNITPPPNSRILPQKNSCFPFKTKKILKKSTNRFRILNRKDTLITLP
jgi:hypothetical protein